MIHHRDTEDTEGLGIFAQSGDTDWAKGPQRLRRLNGTFSCDTPHLQPIHIFFSEQRGTLYQRMKVTVGLWNINSENPSAFSGPIGFDLPVPARLA